MASTSPLDFDFDFDFDFDSASNHSDKTPIPETEPFELEPTELSVSPPSPNAIERFPEEQQQLHQTKATLKLSSAVKCSLPSVVTDEATTEPKREETETVTVTGTETFPRRPPRKSVRFSPMVRVKDTLSHREMSLKEHYDYWIQDHEFLVIKQSNQNTVRVVEESRRHEDFGQTPHTSKIVLDESHYCLRGLESGLRNENLRKRSYRFAALEEVFLEQEDQYYAGIYDDEAIAEVYFEVTAECRFRAEFRALLDRKEILEYASEVDLPQQPRPQYQQQQQEQEQDQKQKQTEEEDCDEFAI